MNRRIALAKHWLFHSKNQISLFELLAKMLEKTCDIKAKPFIDEISEEGEYLKVKLKDMPDFLYYPKKMALRSLYQVITESTDKKQWHYYEIPETQVMVNDVVVDCGAAEGLFSLMVANRCEEVYAIEPLPQFTLSMEKTFSNYNNVHIIPCALSDKTGSAFIDEHDISSTISSNGSVAVELETIDNLFYRKGIKVNYLKADLEGFEMDMLNGASETIKHSKPKIAITTYHKAEHADEIRRFLLNIHPDYKLKVKGIEERAGAPVMLHAW